MRPFIALLALTIAGAAPALAQAPAYADEFARGYGMEIEAWTDPIQPGTRDGNGNRLIVDGRIMPQSSLIGGLVDAGSADSLSALAVGNQLTVVTQGSWNTVIIDSTQINNGAVTAALSGD